MSRAAQECKGNNAAHVKRTTPRHRPGLVEKWPYNGDNRLVETAIQRKKNLDSQPECDIIIFTKAASARRR